MGFHSSDALSLAFDLETVPIDGVDEFIEPVSAPGNYKKPEAIASYVHEKMIEKRSKAALDPALCRIVALGWQREDEKAPVVGVAPDEGAEDQLLQAFWEMAARAPNWVGFAIKQFDIPVLLFRSLWYGIHHPNVMDKLNKYRDMGAIDLMLRLSANGVSPYHSLQFYCRRLGLTTLTADEVTGAQIGELVALGQWQAIEGHCRADVERTVALAQRMQVWHGVSEPVARPAGES